MTRALVLLAEGTEEMEFSIAYDVLVRAGVDVQSVYVPAEGMPNTPEPGYVTAARGVKIVPDTTLAQLGDAPPFDAIVVPGGVGGANILSQDKTVLSMLKSAYDADKVVGAICAGSLAPLRAQIGLGGPITSHPSVKEQLHEGASRALLTSAYAYEDKAVVVAKNLVTSRGPGTSFVFALALVEKLMGPEVRAKVAAPMMLEERL
ncbi:protein deglycase [Malassezia brasiliensis]|uniref:D-lactate dehydratase n=1 Tax=Malassezia brasiliensis TaxID=1821822 RepID=A0AAF0ISB6_9BASI|nr:protein deglycase [Malassezia brasiliensis]